MQISKLVVPNYTLFNLTQTCRYLNCCCNFFLYSATSSLFRRELREIFQCCFSATKHQKQFHSEQTGTVNRTRSPTSPSSIQSTNIDHSIAERKKLLSETTATTNQKATGDKVPVASAVLERKNGHVVTFQT